MKTNRNFIAIIYLINFILFSTIVTPALSSQSKDSLLKEAKLVYQVDTQYINARMKHTFEKIYFFHHPDYKKIISFEEFKYFNGHVAANYKEDKFFQKISGHPSYPSVEQIKKNPVRKGFLNLPIENIYQFIPHALKTIKGHTLENVFIDDSMKLAKATVRLKVSEIFPPSFRMWDVKMKYDVLYIDYWEKVDGKWVLAVMRPYPETKPHISGAKAYEYEHPVPMDKSRWDNAQFKEFKVEELK